MGNGDGDGDFGGGGGEGDVIEAEGGLKGAVVMLLMVMIWGRGVDEKGVWFCG